MELHFPLTWFSGAMAEVSEEEYGEEGEPKLKYERLGNQVTEILKEDAASCMVVHDKFLALGTHFGKVVILDMDGNRAYEFSSHMVTVNQISLDEGAEFMASCSDDGKVFIHGLYTIEHDTSCFFDSPIKAVALHPQFGKNQAKQFVTGSDKLLLCERAWLGRQKMLTLHQGEGTISTIKWRTDLIAWANSKGVMMYDMTQRRRITTVVRDSTDLREEMYPCSLCWSDDLTLLIGWAHSVKVCIVKERARSEARDLPGRYVEIVAAFQMDFFISGLAPLGQHLVVLSYISETDQKVHGKGVASRPQLRILHPLDDDYEELSCDALSIRGYQNYRCRDYHLAAHPGGELMYYIVSPRDVVVAKERDQDDHVAWLLHTKQYEAALLAVELSQKTLKRHNMLEVGQSYIIHLINKGDFDLAARTCQKVLGKNTELWENEVYRFKEIGQLKVISRYIPQSGKCLRPAIYEMILSEFLNTDVEGFAQLVHNWPGNLYNNQVVVRAVIGRLNRCPDQPTLLHTLAELYTYDQRYDKALDIYLKLRHPDVFDLIGRHSLFNAIQDKILLLMEFDPQRAAKMLLENEDKVPINKVVKDLESEPRLMHEYLHRLFQTDPHKGTQYHELQIGLYAEFDRPNLLPFLRHSIHCPLQKALEVCQQRNFVEETIFLLSRMGDSRQALKMITRELNNVDKAIDFAKEQDDPELWDDLINYAITKPLFVTGLLNNIGTHIDPKILIRRIPEGMKIPQLRDSLVKILQDYNLQISLREGCEKILVADCVGLMKKLQRAQRRGVRVDDDQLCETCELPILPEDVNRGVDVIVFFCNHVFHKECLRMSNTSCSICSGRRRGPGTRAVGVKTS
uniref:Vacuolar protein sorting-associated protein 41 homolog n=1 Tax=Eptatretus burgeri TaxID=7764 RepID=A0A8C4NBS6_EPTBU